MKYQGPLHVRVSNDKYPDHVRRMSSTYEKNAMQRMENALQAANYDAFLYSMKLHGRVCTCRGIELPDPLDEDGNMNEDVLDSIISNTINAGKVIGGDDYSTTDDVVIGDYDSYDGIPDTRFDNNSGVGDYTDGNDGDVDAEDESFTDGIDYLSTGFSPLAANCPVCSRTGYVGGFDLVQGKRLVYDHRDLIATGFVINTDTFPNEMQLVDGEGSLDFEFTIPKLSKFAAIRVMSGHSEIVLGHGLKLFLIDDPDAPIEITNYRGLRIYADGRPHEWRATVDSMVTHVELITVANANPIKIDISNFNKSGSSKTMNDVDPITANFPPRLVNINRGDVFFERSSREAFMITNVEMFSTATNAHGASATAERIRVEAEPYSLFNPYKRGIDAVWT